MRPERSTNAFATLEARARELEVESHRDPLTGLANWSWFDGQLAECFGDAHQNRTPLTLLVADIDGLGAVNDSHGHLAGDKVVFSVAACLKRRLRPRDLVARHTGGAFTVLLPRADVVAARAVAERLRDGVAQAQHEVALAYALRITVSVGCVTLARGGFAARQQMVEAALRALRAAKNGGGDRVVALVDNTGESLDTAAPAV